MIYFFALFFVPESPRWLVMKNREEEARTVMTRANGNTYTGDFHHGKYHGEGVLVFADGTRYAGSFKHGMMDGKGKITYPNGLSYEGDFKDDMIVESVAK